MLIHLNFVFNRVVGRKGFEYEVKWVGWDATTWEPESNLPSCTHLIAAYDKEQENQKETAVEKQRQQTERRQQSK